MMQLAIASSPIIQGSHQVTSSSGASWLKYPVRTKIDLEAEKQKMCQRMTARVSLLCLYKMALTGRANGSQ